eukprot:7376103-Prymnesium_polylepis.1
MPCSHCPRRGACGQRESGDGQCVRTWMRAICRWAACVARGGVVEHLVQVDLEGDRRRERGEALRQRGGHALL